MDTCEWDSTSFTDRPVKSKVRRITLKLSMLNQLKWFLGELLRILGGQYQPMHLYLRACFSPPAQAFFFLICAGDSLGIMLRPDRENDLTIFFFLSGFSFTNIYDSQDSKRSGRLLFKILSIISTCFRHLDITWTITEKSSHLHIASSWTQTGNL